VFKKKSIKNAAFTLLNEVLTALNYKSKAKDIFCDIEKTFDCINHDILPHKMELHGISGINKNLYTQHMKN
jgi:hypothetical protein